MPDKSDTSGEVFIKEYPKSTFLLEGKQVLAKGNLILTNKRLVFLRETDFNEKDAEALQNVLEEGDIGRLLQFCLGLHKKNFQVPLTSIIKTKFRYYFMFTIPQTGMRLTYSTGSGKEKTITFRFNPPITKQLLMSEFPTLDWIRAINKAAKAERRAAGYHL